MYSEDCGKLAIYQSPLSKKGYKMSPQPLEVKLKSESSSKKVVYIVRLTVEDWQYSYIVSFTPERLGKTSYIASSLP